MIRPTESVTLDLLDSFVAIMKELASQAKTKPEELKEAHSTPVRRLNEAQAARHPGLKVVKRPSLFWWSILLLDLVSFSRPPAYFAKGLARHPGGPLFLAAGHGRQ